MGKHLTKLAILGIVVLILKLIGVTWNGVYVILGKDKHGKPAPAICRQIVEKPPIWTGSE